jgi:endonuclease III
MIRTSATTGKRPHDIDRMMERLAEAVRPFRPAALFQLAAEGHITPFEQLVACMISTRTRDETTLPAARRLFARARTPAQMVALGPGEIDALILDATFHRPKARWILEIARRAVREFGGALPCDEAVLRSLPGVGPKTAHLVLGIACDQPRIGVDIHVHRVTNRWGYANAPTPESTLRQLEARLPRRYWVEINRVLVPFGKHVCTRLLPRCSTCPVLEYCRQVGVDRHR